MDTLTGEPIAMPLTSASLQMRLDFAGGDYWEWNAAVLYVDAVGTNG
jgi:hypothetical protein